MITLISCITPCRPYIVELMTQSGVNDPETHSLALVNKFCYIKPLLVQFKIQIQIKFFFQGSFRINATIRKYGSNFCSEEIGKEAADFDDVER